MTWQTIYGGRSSDILLNGWPSLALHSMKVFERIHEWRICEKIVQLSNNQRDFGACCGAVGAIHAAHLPVDKHRHREKQKPLHNVFLDFEKAFKRVPGEIIWYFS